MKQLKHEIGISYKERKQKNKALSKQDLKIREKKMLKCQDAKEEEQWK